MKIFASFLIALCLLNTVSFGQIYYQELVPEIKLELRDVIDVLAEWDLHHVEGLPYQFVPYYGMSDPSTRTIYIFDVNDRSGKRETVIHELLHILYNRDSKIPSEAQIEAHADRLYKELYETYK